MTIRGAAGAAPCAAMARRRSARAGARGRTAPSRRRCPGGAPPAPCAGIAARRICTSSSLAVTGAMPVLSSTPGQDAQPLERGLDEGGDRAGHQPGGQRLARARVRDGAGARSPSATSRADVARRPRRSSPNGRVREQVVVQVVAVRRPDAVAEPHPRVAAPGRAPAPATTTRRSSAGARGRRHRDGRPAAGRPEPAPRLAAAGRRGCRGPRSPRGRAPAGLPERTEHGLGRHHRAARAGGARARRCRRAARGGRRRRRRRAAARGPPGRRSTSWPAAIAEVQIGDDQRAHGGAR